MMETDLQSQLSSIWGIGAAIPFKPGMTGLVHVTGRNDSLADQCMGIWWQVTDPDGIKLTPYSEWDADLLGRYVKRSPGAEHTFTGGRFPINKPGDWQIKISLRMDPAVDMEVASYIGLLCRVAAIELKGTITKKQLEYNGTYAPIPVT